MIERQLWYVSDDNYKGKVGKVASYIGNFGRVVIGLPLPAQENKERPADGGKVNFTHKIHKSYFGVLLMSHGSRYTNILNPDADLTLERAVVCLKLCNLALCLTQKCPDHNFCILITDIDHSHGQNMEQLAFLIGSKRNTTFQSPTRTDSVF